MLNGYIEDLLYFSIVDIMGDVLWCEGTAYGAQVSYINGASLHLRSWDEKQDTLVSGTNIKTINGESILGGGNITISNSGSSSSSSAKEVVVVEATYYSYGTYAEFKNILPNKIYICKEVVDYVNIGFNNDTSSEIEDFTVMFKPLGSTSLSITGTPSWANAITPEFEASTMYELSLRRLASEQDVVFCCGASFNFPLSGTDPA